MHKNDPAPIEAIDFESLQAPPQADRTQSKTTTLIIWFAFAVLTLCVGGVFFLLPNYVAERQDEAGAKQRPTATTTILDDSPKTVTPQPDPQADPAADAAQLAALEKEAEKRLLIVIEKQKLLEEKAVEKWAKDAYRAAVSSGATGDEHFRKQEFEQAIDNYADAADALIELEHDFAPTLAMHLEKGEHALSQAEKNTAMHHFELAIAMDPVNRQALHGLQRASTIAALYRMLERGGHYEAAKRLQDAKTVYQQAHKLDPLSSAARAALDRVNARLLQIEFTRLLNQGHALLEQRQYGDARNAFEAAQALLPNATKPQQGLAAVERAIRDATLAALITEAQQFEALEDWSNAVDSYQQILNLSPDSDAARLGLESNQHRQMILTRLLALNDNFLRLGSEAVSNDAEQWLQEVDSMTAPGKRIKTAAHTLKQQLILAHQPITITLQSDERTDISIYKVAKLGKFSSRQIALKPGHYTIVGAREGFRDVRQVVTVLADMDTRTFRVQCEESIGLRQSHVKR